MNKVHSTIKMTIIWILITLIYFPATQVICSTLYTEKSEGVERTLKTASNFIKSTSNPNQLTTSDQERTYDPVGVSFKFEQAKLNHHMNKRDGKC